MHLLNWTVLFMCVFLDNVFTISSTNYQTEHKSSISVCNDDFLCPVSSLQWLFTIFNPVLKIVSDTKYQNVPV